MYIRGVVSSTIECNNFSQNLWKANNQDLDQVLGRIQNIVCTQLNTLKREIRDDQATRSEPRR